ncbi:MAG: cell division protein FtsB [Pseudomonadota bacterium]
MKNLFLGLLLLLLVLQLTLWLGDGGLLDLWDQYQNVEVQREENERLRERNAALNAEVLDLKQGLDAVEEHAREDLGMVKEGEVFYQVVE